MRPRFQHPGRLHRLLLTSIIHSSPWRGGANADVALLSVVRAPSSIKQYRSRSVSKHPTPSRKCCERPVNHVREASRFCRLSGFGGVVGDAHHPSGLVSNGRAAASAPDGGEIASSPGLFSPIKVTGGGGGGNPKPPVPGPFAVGSSLQVNARTEWRLSASPSKT